MQLLNIIIVKEAGRPVTRPSSSLGPLDKMRYEKYGVTENAEWAESPAHGTCELPALGKALLAVRPGRGYGEGVWRDVAAATKAGNLSLFAKFSTVDMPDSAMIMAFVADSTNSKEVYRVRTELARIAGVEVSTVKFKSNADTAAGIFSADDPLGRGDGMPKRPCTFYAQGKCTRGDAGRFSHE